MISILKKLYYSNFNSDEFLYTKDPEYLRINDQVIEAIKELKEIMPEEDFKKVTDLLELHTESGALEVADSFVYGFKYGALIMMEVLKDTEILDKSH